MIQAPVLPGFECKTRCRMRLVPLPMLVTSDFMHIFMCKHEKVGNQATHTCSPARLKSRYVNPTSATPIRLRICWVVELLVGTLRNTIITVLLPIDFPAFHHRLQNPTNAESCQNLVDPYRPWCDTWMQQPNNAEFLLMRAPVGD